MNRRIWKAGGVIIGGLILAVCAFGLLYSGFIESPGVPIPGLTVIDRPSAERAYRRLPASASTQVRESAAARLVETAPAYPQSWEAVSYAERMRYGAMTPGAALALDHAYAVSLFDPPTAVWRIGYALDNWPAIPMDLRRDVLAESGIVMADPALRPSLLARLRTVKSPEGRLAAAMVLIAP